jgi:hypothetical protein
MRGSTVVHVNRRERANDVNGSGRIHGAVVRSGSHTAPSPAAGRISKLDGRELHLRTWVSSQIMPGLRNINDAQGIAGGYPKATLEGALADRAELLRTWEGGTVAASTGEHTAVDAAVQSYATRSSLGDAAYFAVKVRVESH